MQRFGIVVGIIVALALGLGALAGHAVRQEPILSVQGADLYRNYCAACHGVDGRGGGPVASVRKIRVPDLTLLSRRNGGEFPATRVQHFIAGDAGPAAHGSRTMPVWGPIFHQIENDRDWGYVRIQNLTNYLASLQRP